MDKRAMENVITTYVHVRDIAEAILMALEKEHNEGKKYLVGKYQLSLKEYDELISQVSGVSLARIRIPDFTVTLFVQLSTLWADLTKRPPMLGISTDALRVARAGLVFDGNEAEKELGITYTPIRDALQEAITPLKLLKRR